MPRPEGTAREQGLQLSLYSQAKKFEAGRQVRAAVTPRLKNNEDGASRPHCWREDGRIGFWGIASGRIYLYETPMDGNLLRMARVVLRSVFFSLTLERGF